MATVAYQGHPGAFSDVAAQRLVPGAQTHGYPSFDAVASALAGGEVEFGVLPVENAIAGPVPRSYELLWEHPALRVRGELTLPVELCLIGVEGSRSEDIREVRSHPVALEQVRRAIEAHGWERSTSTDTAGAGRDIVARGDRSVAAIGPALAAEIYGGSILARDVQDEPDNSTRFFLLACFDAAAAGDRACIGIAVADRPGSLRDALGAFADRGIDLRFLIARPDRRVAFRYRFFVELANVDGPRLDAALAAIGSRSFTRYVTIRVTSASGSGSSSGNCTDPLADV